VSSATLLVTYAGWPTAAFQDVNNMFTTGAGQVAAHSRLASSGDISSMLNERPIARPIVDTCSNWVSD
jgi:hypothetical protein